VTEPVVPAPDVGGLAQTVLRTQTPEVNRCYEAGLALRPDLAGRVDVRVSIGAEGRVTSVTVVESTLGDAQVEACIARTLSDARFPPTVGTTQVEMPFVFRAR
jgi:TonB family protein